MARGKSLSPSLQNTNSLPRQTEKQNRFLNLEQMMTDVLQHSQQKHWNKEVRNNVNEQIYMAMQPWPLSEKADLAPTLSCRLNCNSLNRQTKKYCTCYTCLCKVHKQASVLFLCLFPSRWRRAAAGAPQASTSPPRTRDGRSPLLTVHCWHSFGETAPSWWLLAAIASLTPRHKHILTIYCHNIIYYLTEMKSCRYIY